MIQLHVDFSTLTNATKDSNVERVIKMRIMIIYGSRKYKTEGTEIQT